MSDPKSTYELILRAMAAQPSRAVLEKASAAARELTAVTEAHQRGEITDAECAERINELLPALRAAAPHQKGPTP